MKCNKQPARLRTGYKKYNIEEFDGKKGVCKIVLWSKKTGSPIKTITKPSEIRKILRGN